MASLRPCRDKIYKKGVCVGVFGRFSDDEAERLCQETQRRTGEGVDWHYIGGRVRVLTLGDLGVVTEIFNEVSAGLPPRGCLGVEEEELCEKE